jgi:hypothetical protein
MSNLAFILALVQTLVWPLTVIAVVVILRAAIVAALSGPLKRLKAGPTGVELEMWEGKIAVIREELNEGSRRQIPARPNVEVEDGGSLVEELAPVAEVSPEAAIVEGYARLERGLRLKLASKGKEPDVTIGGRNLARLAQREGVISDLTAHAIDGLAVLRNLAAHGQAPSDLNTARALDYLAMVDGTLFALRQSKG